jgi:hypothetical protein
MSLYSDLLEVFGNNGMLKNTGSQAHPEYPNATKEYIAEGITQSVQASLESGSPTLGVYSGQASTGTSPATVLTVSGSISASGSRSQCKSKILSVIDGMSTGELQNDDWAEGLAEAIDLMTKNAQVNENIAGTVIPPAVPPPTIPFAGTASGNLVTTAVKSALVNGFKSIPNLMLQNTGSSDNPNYPNATNEFYAQQISTFILTYFLGCSLSMTGSGGDSGLTSSSGKMVGNI